MSRTTVILLSILGVAIIAGGAYLWMNKSTISNPFSTNTANTNLAFVSNTNTTTANLNLSTADTLKGDKDLDSKLTVAGTEIHVTSSLKTATYEGVAAPSGKQFLVIYFEAIPSDKVSAVNQALMTDAHLIMGKDTIALTGLKVATTTVKNDRGYLKFIVPAASTGLKLEVGTGAAAEHVTLAY